MFFGPDLWRQYLHESTYPLVSSKTILQKSGTLKINFKIFKNILQPLKSKVTFLDTLDCLCAVSICEMQIFK